METKSALQQRKDFSARRFTGESQGSQVRLALNETPWSFNSARIYLSARLASPAAYSA
jgi:hypothetical protein